MIDKITPRPTDSVEREHCHQQETYVAPFVNAEEAEYLVIELWTPRP